MGGNFKSNLLRFVESKVEIRMITILGIKPGFLAKTRFVQYVHKHNLQARLNYVPERKCR